MNKLPYTIHGGKSSIKKTHLKYRYGELVKMTTYQLREICYNEKLVRNSIAALNRDELVRLIMKYRGKKETQWIREARAEASEMMEMLTKRTRLDETNAIDIRIPARIVVYQGTDLDYFDRVVVKTDEKLEEGNLLLVDEQDHIYTILNLEKTPDDVYYITKRKEIPVLESTRKQYSILYLGEQGSDILYDLYYGNTNIFPPSMKVQRIPIIDFQVKTLKESNSPLVIDFGSSNTTLGIYEKESEYHLVHVLNQMETPWEETTVIPSVIGVREFREADIRFAFGYQAQKMQSQNYLDEEVSVFYDIKRWVNDIKRQEKIISTDGAYTWISRSDLLRAYMEYLIGLAVQRFKRKYTKIQVLSPVRQKEKFKRVFKELLYDYEVDCSLDEGVAVLFDSIGTLIDYNQYVREQWYQALIIDCGGGTTDLTASRFKIDNNRVSYRIDLETSYENGDTNFGGNNLTYRLLQLLKIRLAEQFSGKELEGKLKCLSPDHFRFIDEQGIGALYQDLDAAYESAEEILPTRFADYEQDSAAEYFKVKNNFFYLFELAEEMKKKFFSDEEYYEIVLGWNGERKINRKTGFLQLDKWKLSVKKGSSFLKELPSGELLFYLYEVRSMLLADVYGLIKKFLEEDFRMGRLREYKLIKLTGQTCQAGLFTEALKEYIPGRILQNAKKKDPHELKVCCLSGALFYFQNKKMGYMDIVQRVNIGALPYEVAAFNHEYQEKTLVASLTKQEGTGHISRYMEGDQVEFFLRDVQGTELKRYLYQYETAQLSQITYEELKEQYDGRIIQDETDNIVDGESKFFVWASREEWGFFVVPVVRKQGLLYYTEGSFFDFEDDTWEKNYFDGRK